jgi:hypothetical protein
VVPEKEVQDAMKRQQQNIPLKGSSSSGGGGGGGGTHSHSSGPKRFDSKKGPHQHQHQHQHHGAQNPIRHKQQPTKVVVKKADE